MPARLPGLRHLRSSEIVCDDDAQMKEYINGYANIHVDHDSLKQRGDEPKIEKVFIPIFSSPLNAWRVRVIFPH